MMNRPAMQSVEVVKRNVVHNEVSKAMVAIESVSAGETTR